MSVQKPTILLIHGGWHHPFCYDALVEHLKALGYPVLCPQLRTLGADTHGLTPAHDVALIRHVALPLFENGDEVVLVGHSYGGIPSCTATEGYTVQERAQRGLPGGFKAIVFLAAFAIPRRGMDLLQAFGCSWAPWQTASTPYTRDQLIHVNEKSKHAFYNDVSPNEAQQWFEKLVPHSQDAFETPVEFVAADLTIPKGYIVCEQDQAISRDIQETLVSSIPGFIVERMQCGHSPFISQPKDCAQRIDKIIGQMQ